MTDSSKDAVLKLVADAGVACLEYHAHALEHTGGCTTEQAPRVSETMLPEILLYDPTGRRLSRTVAGRSPTTLPMPF
jgi:hypothetical protein